MNISPYNKLCYDYFGGDNLSGTYTEARAKAVKKYLSHIGEYKLRVSKEDKERYMRIAKSAGMSLNAYIIQALEEKIQRDGE